jgi:hypothetical protein
VDTESLLRSLNEHKVRYVVIGASAFPIHGYARATLDLAIFIEPLLENARRAHAALVAFGYDLSSVDVEELRSATAEDGSNHEVPGSSFSGFLGLS